LRTLPDDWFSCSRPVIQADYVDLGGDKSDLAAGVAIDNCGRIVVAGKAQRNIRDDYDFAVARLSAAR